MAGQANKSLGREAPEPQRARPGSQQSDFGNRLERAFSVLASRSADIFGTPFAFAVAIGIIVAWGITGPAFGFSDTWQLVINTATTIVTFLMVFLIQNTQNRDSKAIHAKLDELILYTKGASNRLVGAERRTDRELRLIDQRLERKARRLPGGRVPEVDPPSTLDASQKRARAGSHSRPKKKAESPDS